MGLAERRLAEQIKTEQVPRFQADLQAAMGFAPEVDIEWASLMTDTQRPLTRMQDNLFTPLVDAMKSIGRDAMGKEALAESIQKIVIRNVATEQATVTLADKTLTLTAALGDDTYYSLGYSDIVSYLEPKL
ncbi:MAG: hypothetical protein ACRYFX_19380 [Janthinobacterium lividum]